MYYNTKSSDNTYNTGDPVWLYNPKKKECHQSYLEIGKDPTVVKPINDLVYRIQLGPRTKPKVVHWNRLWRYNGDNPPKWLGQHTTQTKPMETPVKQNLEPEMANQNVESKEQEELAESVEDGGLRRSTQTRKPPTCNNPASTWFSLTGRET